MGERDRRRSLIEFNSLSISVYVCVLTLRPIVVVAVAVHRVVDVVVHIVVVHVVAVGIIGGATVVAGTCGASTRLAAVHLVFVMIVLIVGAQEGIFVHILNSSIAITLLQFVCEISHGGHCKQKERKGERVRDG